MRKASESIKTYIKEKEGLRLTSYLCPANVWTIGWGHTLTARPNMTITIEQAQRLFDSDLEKFEKGVNQIVAVPLTQGQFDALVSFAYNVGIGNLQQSTLLRKLNLQDYKGAAQEFDRWVFAGGKRLNGLVRRRADERRFFESDSVPTNNEETFTGAVNHKEFPLPQTQRQHGEPDTLPLNSRNRRNWLCSLLRR
jgi:lysozyme